MWGYTTHFIKEIVLDITNNIAVVFPGKFCFLNFCYKKKDTVIKFPIYADIAWSA